jgi:glycosyltransferase involved in cell wall biosynthesis
VILGLLRVVTASIVICTHNRARILARAVDEAVSQARAAGAEVVVVDNASSDDTPAVLAGLVAHAAPTLRAVREARLGLSAARNRGLAHARGALAVFLDDDAVPRPGWLPALLAPFAAPEIVCVGGRILLAFSVPPPPWLTPALHPALSAFDLGDEPRRVPERPGDHYPYGGNIAFRTATVRALGGFATRMGLRGASGLQQEETDLCWRIDRSGGEIRYAPDAVVDHWVFPERLLPEWFFARFALAGKSNAIFELKNRGLHRALGLLRWHYVPRLSLRRYRPAASVDADRLLAECRRREALGYLRGLAAGIPRLPALRRERLLAVAS